MNISRSIIASAIVVTGALLGGCGSTTTTTVPVSSQVSSSYGVIDSIQIVQVETEKSNSGVGAVTGGVVGGVLGNTVGGGTGKAAATVAGVVGGALVGNKIEEHEDAPRAHDAYQIVVRMDAGGYQTVTQGSLDNNLQVGTRVYVENGRVYPT
jgi:outer membrane lipoprotein SlyB